MNNNSNWDSVPNDDAVVQLVQLKDTVPEAKEVYDIVMKLQ